MRLDGAELEEMRDWDGVKGICMALASWAGLILRVSSVALGLVGVVLVA